MSNSHHFAAVEGFVQQRGRGLTTFPNRHDFPHTGERQETGAAPSQFGRQIKCLLKLTPTNMYNLYI